MGGYLSATQLSAFLPNRFQITASSIPDLTTTDLWCDLIGDELNAAALRGGWSVPVASGATMAYGVMALYNQYGAGWHVLEQRLGYGEDGKGNPRAVEYRNAYQAAIKALETGQLQLPGADQASGSERVLPISNSGSGNVCCATGTLRFNRPVNRCTEF